MSQVPFEDLLDMIRPEVRSCPTDLIVQAMLDVTRDFCNITRALVYEAEGESITSLVSDYDIDLPNDQVQPCAIEYMTVDGAPCEFKDVAWLDANVTDWRYRSADDFRFFTQLQPLVITFPCVPTRNGTIGGVNYRVSLKPTNTATTLDEVFADEWLDVLSDGVKAKLKAMSDQPWGNEKRAALLALDYRRGRTAARIRTERSYGNPDLQMTPPRRFA